MPQFLVDEDLAALVEKLAKPKPFEHITFNAALRRVLGNLIARLSEADKEAMDFAVLDRWMEEEVLTARTKARKAKSPAPQPWLESVPELRSVAGLKKWNDVCVHLGINPSGDSARRKLAKWVEINRPAWPPVPANDGGEL
jgi:hypothetical protein